jgi:hypothetical protein
MKYDKIIIKFFYVLTVKYPFFLISSNGRKQTHMHLCLAVAARGQCCGSGSGTRDLTGSGIQNSDPISDWETIQRAKPFLKAQYE